MTPAPSTRYMPAEWEGAGAVLLSWPHKDTDWAPMLDEVTRCFVDIAKAITDDMFLIVAAPDIEVPKKCLQELDADKVFYVEVPTNDTWARDFGPITVIENGHLKLLDFKFNGWGLKFAACHDNLINRRLSNVNLLTAPLENHLGFVLEGGSIESDGRGTLMTTSECLLSPNRNGSLTKSAIEAYLKWSLGVKRVLWVDHGYLAGDDTDSHIDTLARFAPDDTILYVKCDDPSDEHYDELRLMEGDLRSFRTEEGLPYHLIALPMAEPVIDEDGYRLPATYANFLITSRSVLMPTYRQPRNDELAAQILKIAFPDKEIKKIDCSPLIRQHGSLHCVTMQLSKDVLPL